MFNKFRQKEKERVADSKWNRTETSLKSFLRYVHGHGLIDRPLYEVVPRIKEQVGKEVEIVEENEMIKVEEYLAGLVDSGRNLASNYLVKRLRLIWCLFSLDGVRVGELSRIDITDLKVINAEKGIGSVYIKGKGKRNRTVYLHPETYGKLLEYLLRCFV